MYTKGRARAAGTVLTVALIMAGSTTAQVQVSVDKGARYQTIKGFGASVTDNFNIRPWKVRSGPFLVDINLDSVGFYDSVITELGATAIRTNIVTSFSPASGQYAVSGNMMTLWEDLRKLKEAAQRHDEPLLFIGTPWSPPGWMKVNESGPCVRAGAPNYNATDCRLKDGYDDTLANYLVKYVQTMTDSGLPYYAISVQNEPAFTEPYESCVYNGARYAMTLKAIGRAFQSAGLPQKVYGAEHMSRAFPGQIERSIRADDEALGYMEAWAIHGYYSDGVTADTGSFGGSTEDDKPLWMTETSGSAYGESWADWGKALDAAKVILSYLRNGKISLWTWWILQAPGDNSYAGNLHAGGRATLKWHVSRHFFRFIRPGARQVRSTSNDSEVLTVAFWNEGGQCFTVVLVNMSTSAKTVNGISVSGGSAPATFERITSTATEQNVASTVGASEQITLPAQSVTTLVAGTYRGSDTVSVTHEPNVSPRATQNITRIREAQRVYGIDGRLISSTGIDGLRARGVGSANVYIMLDARGRAVKACGQAAGK